MASGFIMALLTGLFLAGFGVAISLGVRKGLDMFQFLFWNAFITALLSLVYPGRPDFAFSQGGLRFGELILWITGGGVCSISASLMVQRAMKHGNNNLVWAIQQAGLLLPFLFGGRGAVPETETASGRQDHLAVFGRGGGVEFAYGHLHVQGAGSLFRKRDRTGRISRDDRR